jgi:general secretion pathway protein J
MLGNEAGNLTLAEGVTQWQVYFHRGGSWTNPQSTGNLIAPQAPQQAPQLPSTAASAASAPGTAPTAPAAPAAPAAGREQLPDAVRLVIAFPAGTVTRDILLGPTGGS